MVSTSLPISNDPPWLHALVSSHICTYLHLLNFSCPPILIFLYSHDTSRPPWEHHLEVFLKSLACHCPITSCPHVLVVISSDICTYLHLSHFLMSSYSWILVLWWHTQAPSEALPEGFPLVLWTREGFQKRGPFIVIVQRWPLIPLIPLQICNKS